VTANPVIGQAISVGVSVSGPTIGAGSLTPTGQVTVSDGKQNCEAHLSGSNGGATGSCSITERAADSYGLTATYAGDGNFAASATSSATMVTVALTGSRTVLALSLAKVTYGNEGAERLSVTVAPGFGGSTPTGAVTVTESTTSLCKISLSGAKGSCTLSARKLSAGTYHLIAKYGGSTDFAGSTTSTLNLTVTKAHSRIVLKLSVAKATYGKEGAERLSVTVSPEFADSAPSGTVTVKESTKSLCTISLSRARGSCTLSPRKLSAGIYHLVARYHGGTNFSPSASRNKTLIVVK